MSPSRHKYDHKNIITVRVKAGGLSGLGLRYLRKVICPTEATSHPTSSPPTITYRRINIPCGITARDPHSQCDRSLPGGILIHTHLCRPRFYCKALVISTDGWCMSIRCRHQIGALAVRPISCSYDPFNDAALCRLRLDIRGYMRAIWRMPMERGRQRDPMWNLRENHFRKK